MEEIKALIGRIETGARIEGDPDCVFFGGHWHGEPVEGGTVGLLSEGELVIVPTPEFVVDGKILWDLDENGGVHPKGTLEKKAAEEAKATEAITPEPPHEDAVETHPDATPEPTPEELLQTIAPEAPAEAAPSPEVEPAPAQQEAPAPITEGTDAPVSSETAPSETVPSETAPAEAPAPVPEDSPAVTEETAPEATVEATEAPAEVPADAPADPAPAPVVKKKKSSSL